MHFPQGFAIIAKHGKLVWLSRQSDSLVMNRSAVRIRPPAPHSRKASYATPRRFCGVFAFVPAAVFPQKKNARCSLAPRFFALLKNYPPLTHFSFAGRAGFLVLCGRILTVRLRKFTPREKSKIFPAGTPTPPARLCSLGVSGVLGERNKLPSSDMEVRSSPLLRVPPKTIPPCGAPRF